MMHIAYSPYFHKIYKFLHISAKFMNPSSISTKFKFFCITYIFCFPLFWPWCIWPTVHSSNWPSTWLFTWSFISICNIFSQSTHPSHPTILPIVHMSISPSISLSYHLSVCLPNHPSHHLQVLPSYHQSVRLTIRPSTQLSFQPLTHWLRQYLRPGRGNSRQPAAARYSPQTAAAW